jgi:hypothetical protein
VRYQIQWESWAMNYLMNKEELPRNNPVAIKKWVTDLVNKVHNSDLVLVRKVREELSGLSMDMLNLNLM